MRDYKAIRMTAIEHYYTFIRDIEVYLICDRFEKVSHILMAFPGAYNDKQEFDLMGGTYSAENNNDGIDFEE